MCGQAKRRRRWSPTLAEKTARVGYPLFRDQSLYNFSRARDCFCPSEADLVPAPPFTLGDGRNSRSLISSLRLRMPRPLLAHWRPVCDPAQIRVVHPPAEESPREATEFPFARAQVRFLFPSAIHVCLSWISRHMCSSALGDGPGKVTSPSTFAQGQKLAVYRGRRAPRGFQRIGYYKQAEAHVSRCSRRGPIESMISLGNKLPNSLIGLRQRLLIR